VIAIRNTFKGGIIGLLCFFGLNGSGFCQSFFHADTSVASERYGSVSTGKLPERVIESLEKANPDFNEWIEFFHLKTLHENPPMLGEFILEADRIIFIPRFLPDPSITYLVKFSFPKLSSFLKEEIGYEEIYMDEFVLDVPESNATSVILLTPDSSVLPANVLRTYIYFSAPMGFQNPYEHIEIYEMDQRLKDPFVVVPEGLWNEDRTRLTLLFHPGRIKQGVGPNMTQGSIFEEGRTYRLVINQEWKDANGNALENSYESSFTAGPEIREQIRYKQWTLTPSADGSRSTLIVETNHPIDEGIAQRMLSVRPKNGELLQTETEFVSPTKIALHWNIVSSEVFELLIDPRLEDICGNTPLNRFDYELGKRKVSTEPLIRDFEMK